MQRLPAASVGCPAGGSLEPWAAGLPDNRSWGYRGLLEQEVETVRPGMLPGACQCMRAGLGAWPLLSDSLLDEGGVRYSFSNFPQLCT